MACTSQFIGRGDRADVIAFTREAVGLRRGDTIKRGWERNGRTHGPRIGAVEEPDAGRAAVDGSDVDVAPLQPETIKSSADGTRAAEGAAGGEEWAGREEGEADANGALGETGREREVGMVRCIGRDNLGLGIGLTARGCSMAVAGGP